MRSSSASTARLTSSSRGSRTAPRPVVRPRRLPMFPKLWSAVERRGRVGPREGHARATAGTRSDARAAHMLPPTHPSRLSLGRYYWFHASLSVGCRCTATPIPTSATWRVEPDVIFAAAGSAPLSLLLIGAAHSLGDVLLPQTTSQCADRFRHLRSTALPIQPRAAPGHPARSPRVGARVGRAVLASYIRRLEAEKWRYGIIGYEEITLPTWCLAATRSTGLTSGVSGSCELARLGAGRPPPDGVAQL